MVWWEFTLNLEDVAWLTLLNMFTEDNAIEIIIEGEDHVKLKYVIVAMTASRSLGKSTYERGYGFSMKVMTASLNSWLGLFLCTCYLGMYCLVDLMGSKP